MISGNVGIGTTSPQQKLTVQGTLNVTTGAAAALNPSLFIEGVTGLVGIGTTIPSAELHISVNTTGDSELRIVNTGNVSGSGRAFIRLDSGGSAGGDAAIFFNIPNENSFIMGIDNDDSDKFKISGPTGGALGVNDRFTIDSSGNLGIGTTTPGQTLHVVGNANVSQTLNAPVINTTRSDQNITISSAAGSVIIRLG